MVRSMFCRSLVLGSFAIAGVSFTACNQAPRGDEGSRIGTNERTRADRIDTQADSVTLIEFSDQVAQAIAARISKVPEIRNSQQKVIIELGDIQNNTRTPKSDFAAIQRRIFITLSQSDIIGDNCDVVEPTSRMDRQLGGISQAPQNDPTGRTEPTAPGTARYDANITFFLQGTFNELTRVGGVQSTFNFDFTLVNAASRRIVIAEQITPKQVR